MTLTRQQLAIMASLLLVGCLMACVFGYLIGTIVPGSVTTRELTGTPPLPTATPGPTPTPVTYEFQGRGDDVVSFAAPVDGLAYFIITHHGDRHFAVKLLAGDGEYIDLLVNQSGAYDGKRTVGIVAGEYVLEVTADGDWSIVIAPPQ